ncbi:AMP-binding protein, partial [Planktothrix sp.]|uniref:AMP-binding protein n=1 Tax=Planktothrix sp. TaxID=3088171 RepID=UPI0038D3B5B5
MRTDHQNLQLNCQKLAEILLSNPLIEDCYFLVRQGELVAYIVSSGTWNPEQLSSDLKFKLPDNLLPNIYVQISSLPLTDSGDIDETALKNIEIIDDNQVQETEEKLRSLLDIDQVAVVLSSQKIKIPPLHLSDLLPFKKRENIQHQNPEVKPEISLPIHASNTQLALSHGQPLEQSVNPPKTLGEILKKAAENYSDKGILYIQSNGSQIFKSYQQLWEEAETIQAGLQKLGLQAQDKVILQLSENYDIISAFWGCLLGGFIPVIISVPASYQDLNQEVNKICQVLELLDYPIIITNKSRQQEIKYLEQWLPHHTLNLSFIEELTTHSNPHPHISQPDDIAFFNLTSGSTGMPKCISLTHKNVISRARGTNVICEHQNNDIILNWLPFDHIGSISDWNIRCVELGCQMVYVQTEYILGRPLNWLDLIDQYRITHSWAPNFAYNLINEALKKEPNQTWNLDCVKFFLAAGEAVSGQAVGEFIKTLHLQYHLKKTAMRPAFGMAEMGSGITYYQPTDQQPLLFHTVDKSSLNSALKRVHPEHPNGATFTDLGLPIPGISIRIVNADNSLLPEETIGHLQVKGDPVSPGYYKNPEANQDAFLKDGWFKTGDLAFISKGHLVITGRSKETIIINGVNYYSHEIETVVETIEEVEASYTAACAVHDPKNSTDQLALFFSTETFDHQHLAELLKKIRRKVIKNFGVNPEYLIPLNKTEIPKTSIGKIQRSQLT